MASTNFRLVAVADILLLHINDPFHTNQSSQRTKPETKRIGLTKHVSLVLPLTSGAKMASTNFRLVAVADILLLRINDPFHTNPSPQTHETRNQRIGLKMLGGSFGVRCEDGINKFQIGCSCRHPVVAHQ